MDLPIHATQQCLLYNKKLFEEAGLDREHAPKTWKEFCEYAKKLTKYDSNGFVTQLGVSQEPWVYQLENSNGTAGTFKEDRISSNYDSEWILKLHEFCNKCYAITENQSAAKDLELEFSKGNVAMIIGDFQGISDIELKREDMGIAYVPRPDDINENYIPSLLFYFIGIPAGCANPEGGWTFMKYLITDGAYLQNSERFMDKPLEFIPGQLAHLPTKEKVYEEFVPQLSDAAGLPEPQYNSENQTEWTIGFRKNTNSMAKGIQGSNGWYCLYTLESNKGGAFNIGKMKAARWGKTSNCWKYYGVTNNWSPDIYLQEGYDFSGNGNWWLMDGNGRMDTNVAKGVVSGAYAWAAPCFGRYACNNAR